MSWKRGSLAYPLLALLVFLPGVACGLVYDDHALIEHNTYVQSLEYLGRAFSTHFWDVSGATPRNAPLNYYRPFVTASYLLNWVVNSEAWSLHLVNVCLHAACVGLAFLIGRRWTQSTLLGGVAALIFALHPTRAEPIVWISGRPDPLMTVFLLAAVQLGFWGRGKRWPLTSVLGVCLSLGAALLCKEPALAAPLLLLVDAADCPRRSRRWHLVLAGLAATLAAGYVVARHRFMPIDPPPLELTPRHGLITIAHYFERIIFPWPLTFFYKLQEWGANGPIYPAADLILGLGVVLAGLAFCWFTWKRDRVAFILLVATAAFLGPLLNFTQTGSKFTTSDRFLYLPLWLLTVALFRVFREPLLELRKRRSAQLATIGLLLIYAALDVTRILDFRSSATLWASELSLHPDNPVALRGRAAVQVAHERDQKAITILERSLRDSSLKYHTVAVPEYNLDTYARLIHLKARRLPDGAVVELRQIVSDAVERLAGEVREAPSPNFPIDWPRERREARWVALQGEEDLARRLAPITSRLSQRELCRTLLDAVPPQRLHLVPNPLLFAIAEAREERPRRALARLETMASRARFMPEEVTPETIEATKTRIQNAQRLFTWGQHAKGAERDLWRAKAFATLGAYWRALRQLQDVTPSHPEMGPLYVQLLVSARLEKEALTFATQALGAAAARRTVREIRAQLPPDLRSLPPAQLHSASGADSAR